jgi:predicted dehydrogenase
VSTDTTVNVGVIGAGVGFLHIEGFATEPRARVQAIAGLDTDRVQALAKKYDVPRTYSDYREMLEQPDIDAVSVCVPNYLHAEVTLAAIEAGKHVICEKPMALSVEDAERMVALARDRNRVLTIAFSQRSRNDCQALKRHIVDGGLGDIYYAKASWMRRTGIPGIGSWFTQKRFSGGGALIDLGVHMVDMALWLMGNPQVLSISAATYNHLGNSGWGNYPTRQSVPPYTFDVDDLATAFIRLASGATLHLEASWASHSSAHDDFGVKLYGTKGGGEIFVHNYGYEDTLQLFGTLDGTPTDTRPRLQKLHGHAAVAQSFVATILDGKPANPSGEEGLDRVRVIDAIYRSASEGREIILQQAQKQ